MEPGKSPIQCEECGTHYLVSPGEVIDGTTSCSQCGGRKFRDQPNTIQPEMPGPDEGHLLDFLPAAADGQTSPTGGNPLDEGTIMGSDGERPDWKRDNSFVGKTVTKQMMPETFRQDIYPALFHEATEKTADNTNMWAGGQTEEGPGGQYTQQNREQMTQGMSPAQWAELGGAATLGIGGAIAAPAAAGALGIGEEAAAGGGGVAAEDAAAAGGGAAAGAGTAAKGLGSDLAKGIAGQGAKGVGEGLVKGLPSLMKGALGLGAGGAPPAPAAAPGMVQTGSAEIPMLLLADFETYDSNPSLDSDPNNFDQKQFSDGDQSPSNFHNPNLEDSGANGEDNVRSDSAQQTGFASNSPGIERAQAMLPTLLQYYHNEDAGERDPMVAGLHEMLERENPGYLSKTDPDGQAALQQLIAEQTRPQPMGVHAKTATGPLHRSPNTNYDLGDAQFQSPNGVNDIRMNVSPWGQGEVHDPNLSPRDPRHSIPIGGDDPIGTVMMQGVPEVPNSASFPGASGIPGVYDRLEENGHDWGNVLPIRQGFNTIPGGQPTTTPMPGAPPLNSVPQPQQPGGQCPNCGGVLAPGGSCPQCGNGNTATNVPPMPMGMPPAMAGIAMHLATHQGPVTPEQIAAVQELLVTWDQTHPGEPNRADEAPNVPLHPEQYAKEMAEVQQNPNVAPQIDPSTLPQPTPPPAMQQAPGAMPVTDPSQPGGGGGQPMQPMSAKTADANTMSPRCPNCGSGSTLLDSPGDPTTLDEPKSRCHACNTIFDPSDPKVSSTHTADANTMTPRCPRCGSGTTMVDSPGDASTVSEPQGRCHACHLIFDPANPQAALKKSKVVLFAGEVALPNPHMMDHFRFADASGNDLIEGGTYELRTGASVPTEIKLLKVKPDGLDVQLVGGIGGQVGQPDFRISRQKAEQEKYTFVPLSLPSADSTEPDTTPGVSPEQVPPYETTDETPDSIPHTTEASFENRCGSCGSSMVDSSMSDMLTTEHDCVKCGNHWVSKEEGYEREAGVDLSWLDEDSSGLSDRHMHMERAVGGQSRNLSDVAAKDPRLTAIRQALESNKTAGKHFNAMEKRDLIDETGSARNLEDLDLDGTHYEARVDYSGKANDMNVEDDHFGLGL